jgi:hypothetical protein
MLSCAFRLRLPLVAVLLCLPALAAQARRSRIARSLGIITQVPTPGLRGLLVLEVGDETLTLKTAPDVQVFIEPYPHDEPDKPEARLEVGRAAYVEYNPDTRVAAWVSVSTAPLVTHRTGLLTSADPANGLYYQPYEPDAETPQPSMRLYENAQTRFFLNTLPLSLAELPLLVGQPVDLLLYNASGNLERLRATSTPSPSIDWVVQTVDPATRSLQVARPGSSALLVLPARLAPYTAVGAIPVSALTPGDRVRAKTARLASGTTVVLDLKLQGVAAHATVGRLTGVDQANRTVTVSGRGPSPFSLLPDTPVIYHYPERYSEFAPRPITLAQLTAAGPDYEGVTVRIRYLVRGGRRMAMQLDVNRDGYAPL